MQPLTLKQIKDEVESTYWLHLDNKLRKSEYVHARSMFYSIAKEYTAATFENIGEVVKRSHSSVIHGYNLYLKEFNKNKNFQEKRKYILTRLGILSSISNDQKQYKQKVVDIANTINDIEPEHLDYIENLIDIKLKSWGYGKP